VEKNLAMCSTASIICSKVYVIMGSLHANESRTNGLKNYTCAACMVKILQVALYTLFNFFFNKN